MLDLETANTISEVAATVATAAVVIVGIVWANHDIKAERRRRAAAKRNQERKKREREVKAAGLRLMAEDTRRRTIAENASKTRAAKKNSNRNQYIKLGGFMGGKPKYEAIWRA